uniref:MULE transposase domain-containing protein n=1 Tax=Lactuca sativa TaxID=4236 RepID=A0A9R1V583_LACSA|nr:hypothetical protein LSAT_V11C600316700 [Lactuca sativa]
MDDTISAGDDHSHDQQQYPIDYADHDEDFGLTDHDSLHNIDFDIGDNSNLNLDAENKNKFIDDEADDTIADDNIVLQKEQSHVRHDYVSPGGSPYWIPIVSDHIKPKINLTVDSYEAGFESGLEQLEQPNLALSHNDICYAIGKVYQELLTRKDSFRCECKEKIVFILLHGTNKYIVDDFVEQHTHELFGKDNMFLSRTKRKLDYSQEMFIHNLSNQNSGASRAQRLYTGPQGGSEIRGGLVSDFKNRTRNLNSYIGSRDAKFLADETAKYNYNAFGDVVSLDAKFSMNKYDMVFITFTRIDNHKERVTFCAALLSREDGTSYSWLLRAFLKSFKKQPMLVLTHPDPALNKAVNEVIPMSSHRFCMWHITKKLPNKITSQLATNSDFQKRFHSIIWNSKLEPHDFDNAWKSCLDEFNISNNKCMKEMYGLWRRWVLAFFKDIPMSGLMRTTSLVYWNVKDIINLSMTLKLPQQFLDSSHLVQTKHMLQRSTLVQKEISDSENTCFQISVTSCNGVDIIIVLEKQKNISTMHPTSLVVDDKLEEYHYDCLRKDTQYTLCFPTIIMRRWHWDVIPTELLKRRFYNSLVDSNSNMTVIEIFSNVDRCVSFLRHDAAKLKSYLEKMNNPEMPSRESFNNQIIGVDLTNDVPDIENPSDIRNKETGSHVEFHKPCHVFDS